MNGRLKKIPNHTDPDMRVIPDHGLVFHINRIKKNDQWEELSWYDQIHTLIKNAEQEILIASYTFYLNGTKIETEIINQLKKGVQ